MTAQGTLGYDCKTTWQTTQTMTNKVFSHMANFVAVARQDNSAKAPDKSLQHHSGSHEPTEVCRSTKLSPITSNVIHDTGSHSWDMRRGTRWNIADFCPNTQKNLLHVLQAAEDTKQMRCKRVLQPWYWKNTVATEQPKSHIRRSHSVEMAEDMHLLTCCVVARTTTHKHPR